MRNVLVGFKQVDGTLGVVNTPLADGQVLAGWHFQALDTSRAVVKAADVGADAFETLFTELPAGDYIFTGARLDVTGQVFGNVVEVAFSVVDVVVPTGQAAGVLTVILG